MLGIDGVLLALIITFIILFGSILSGFPVAFAIGGAGYCPSSWSPFLIVPGS